jgi:hypothetical protein
MKQAASLHALASILPRLAQVRRRTWFLLGGGVLLTLVLMAWAAIALLSWLWGQAPTMIDSGRQAAGSAIERAGEVVPGVREALEPWVGSVIPGGERAATAPPAEDVSGVEPPGLERYPGLVRTYYANDAGRVELRYAGAADLRPVLEHYAKQLENAGYRHEIVFASPELEKHRFVRGAEVLDLQLGRSGDPSSIELVVLVQTL